MTNGEKIIEVFNPEEVKFRKIKGRVPTVLSFVGSGRIEVEQTWWNAEYKEPKQKIFDYLTTTGIAMIEGEKISDNEWKQAINAIKDDFKEKAKRQKEKAERESGGKVIEVLFGTKQILRTITKHTKELMK